MLFFAQIFSLNLLATEAGSRYALKTNLVEYLEVTRPNVKLYVPDIGATYEVSDRLPLIQQTAAHYIVGVQSFDGSLQPAAFPLIITRKQGTGWVTKDQFLIFATRTPSTAGSLEFEHKETLAIRTRHQDHYEVEWKRGGRLVVLRIPDGMDGITLKKKEVVVRTRIPADAFPEETRGQSANPTRSVKSSVRPGRKISVSLGEEGMTIEDSEGNVINDAQSPSAESARVLPPAQINFVPPTPLKPPASEVKAEAKEAGASDRVIQELKEVVLLEIVAELQKSKNQLPPDGSKRGGDLGSGLESALVTGEMRAGSTNSNLARELGPDVSNAVALKLDDRIREAAQTQSQAEADAVPGPLADLPESSPPEPGYLRFLNTNSLMFQILLGVCLLEGFLLFNMRLKNRQSQAKPGSTPDAPPDAASYSYNISEEAMISQPDPEQVQAAEGDLSGTLDGYSMGQVVQFFNSSGDDGILVLMSDAAKEDIMIFNNGQIIAATSGELSGEEAVYAMLRRQHGNFSFRRIDTSDHERLILQDTMSLLLEGHRLVDEQGFDAA